MRNVQFFVEPHLNGGVDVLLGSLGRNPQRPKLGKLLKNSFLNLNLGKLYQVIIDPKPEFRLFWVGFL